MNPLLSLCPLLSSIPQTERQLLWSIIYSTWPWNLILISVLILWIVFEIKNRHGKVLYRSKKGNGYTPLFNKFVGSATYFALQALIPLVLSFIFGDAIYCMFLPYVVHLFMFWFTWYFLKNIVKFWVY